jgi:murein DD-endopeptidase MepM/ murein hydrolase activator NlpD
VRRLVAALLVALVLIGAVPVPAAGPKQELSDVERRIEELAAEIESSRAAKGSAALRLLESRAALEESRAGVAAGEAEVEAGAARVAKRREELHRLRRNRQEVAGNLIATRLAEAAERRRLRRNAAAMYMEAVGGGVDLLGMADLVQMEAAGEYTGALVRRTNRAVRVITGLRRQAAGTQQELGRRTGLVRRALDALEAEQAKLEDALESLREVEADRLAVVAEAEARLAELEDEIAAAEQHRQGLEADAARLEAELSQRRPAEEPAPEAPATTTTTEASETEDEGLDWPLWGLVSSGFGWRFHPIYADMRLHTGIDIDGSAGDPIVASAAGVVIIAGSYGGYGNTVAIDHGDGLTTIYAHQDTIAVGYGEWVDEGEVIGTVGCTGLCTGPHLHFETRVWGAATDPLDWLGG